MTFVRGKTRIWSSTMEADVVKEWDRVLITVCQVSQHAHTTNKKLLKVNLFTTDMSYVTPNSPNAKRQHLT